MANNFVDNMKNLIPLSNPIPYFVIRNASSKVTITEDIIQRSNLITIYYSGGGEGYNYPVENQCNRPIGILIMPFDTAKPNGEIIGSGGSRNLTWSNLYSLAFALIYKLENETT